MSAPTGMDLKPIAVPLGYISVFLKTDWPKNHVLFWVSMFWFKHFQVQLFTVVFGVLLNVFFIDCAVNLFVVSHAKQKSASTKLHLKKISLQVIC